MSRHPSLVQAASYIAAAVEKESSSPTAVRVRRRNRLSNAADEGSDEDMANLEPGVRQFIYSIVYLVFTEHCVPVFFAKVLMKVITSFYF